MPSAVPSRAIWSVTPTTAAAIRRGGGKGRGSVVVQARSGGSMRSRKSAMRGPEPSRCPMLTSVPNQDHTSRARMKTPTAALSSARLARRGNAGGIVEREAGVATVELLQIRLGDLGGIIIDDHAPPAQADDPLSKATREIRLM